MFFKLRYTFVLSIFATVIMLIGSITYAQDSDIGEGKSAGASSPPFLYQQPDPQINTINNLIIPADGNEPPRIEDASEKIAIEGKIIQLEQKVDQLIYLNAILLLFIVVTAGSFGIVKIRKKLL